MTNPSAPPQFSRSDSLHLSLGELLSCGGAATLSALLYAAGAGVFAFAPVAIAVLALIVCKPVWGVTLAICTLAWDQIFNPATDTGASAISVGRVLSVIAVIAASRVWLARRDDIVGTRTAFRLFVICTVWYGITASWAPDKMLATKTILSMVVHLAFCYSVVVLIRDRDTLVQLLLLLAAFTASAAVYVTFYSVNIVEGRPDARIQLTGAGVNAFAVQLGYGALASIVCCLAMRGAIMRRTGAVICTLLITVGILRTGTRSVFIGVPLASLFTACVVYRRQFHRVIFVLLATTVLLGGVFFIAVDKGLVSDTVVDRLLGVTHLDTHLSNARWELWALGIDYVSRHAFGTGIGNEGLAFMTYWNGNGEAHNIFVSMLVETGPIGFFLLLFAIGACTASVLQIEQKSLGFAAMLVFSFLILQGMKGSFIETRLFWYPMALVFACIEIASRESRLRGGLIACVG